MTNDLLTGALVAEASREFHPSFPLHLNDTQAAQVVHFQGQMEAFATARFAESVPPATARSLAHQLWLGWADALSETPWGYAEEAMVTDSVTSDLRAAGADHAEAVRVGVTNSWHLFASALASLPVGNPSQFAAQFLAY